MGKLSISDLDHLPQSNSNPASPVAQPSPKKVVFVGLPTSPSSRVKVTGERIRKSHLHARPPPILISPVRANREARQGNSSETAVPISHPASPSSRVTGKRIRKPPRPPPLLISPQCTNHEARQGDSSETADPVNPPASPSSGERIRKPSLPTCPPPLLLHPERIVRKSPKIDSDSVAKSRTITPTDGDNRGSLGSLLPNPWDSDAKPQTATFESPIYQRPSFTGSVRRANTFKARLPRTPRETRTAQSEIATGCPGRCGQL